MTDSQLPELENEVQLDLDSEIDRDQAPETQPDYDEARDFPRLFIEAKVGVSHPPAEEVKAALLSDLSLGGARLATKQDLQTTDTIRIHPLLTQKPGPSGVQHLEFLVKWKEAGREGLTTYGLLHLGTVLDVLNSWLGHLLLRRSPPDQLKRRPQERRTLPSQSGAPVDLRANISHKNEEINLQLVDIAPSGFLAKTETHLPVGVHLKLEDTPWMNSDAPGGDRQSYGSVVDSHTSDDGGSYYRVLFDPQHQLDEASLVDWAESLGKGS